jgi:hypothetical protein
MPVTIGSIIAVHREKGRYNLGKITAVDHHNVEYLRIRDTPHDHTTHYAHLDPNDDPRLWMQIRPATTNIKLLLGTPMLVMTNGFWRLCTLEDYHKDVNMYEVRFKNGRTSWVDPRNTYHVFG